LCRPVEQRPHGAFLSNVALHVNRSYTHLLDLGSRAFGFFGMFEIIEEDIRSFPGKLKRDGLTNSSRCAGDHGGLSLE
jgi:hypothetical protein